MTKLFQKIFWTVLFSSTVQAQDFQSMNLQFHYDIKRDHPTVTQEFFATDKLGYTFFFMDLNFNPYHKPGGLSDVYFEFMRYFTILREPSFDLNLTVQYDDGTAPVERVLLGGINAGNIHLGHFNISTEFLLKKDYKLDVNWQYTVVWFAEFLGGKLIFNGYADFWANDVDDPHWPSFNPEYAASRHSFQTEPQIGWQLNSYWKVGSEIEISRGFIGSVTGKLAADEKYRHDKWYVLPTIFVQYDF